MTTDPETVAHSLIRAHQNGDRALADAIVTSVASMPRFLLRQVVVRLAQAAADADTR